MQERTSRQEIVFGYERLDVYALALSFAEAAYKLLDKYPAKERFRLASQAGRSASSVALNIAEGSGRRHKREFAQYARVAIGSLFETIANLELSNRLQYISDQEFADMRCQAEKLYFKLIALEKYLRGEAVAADVGRKGKHPLSDG
jgi:four helix bundle protein